MSLGLSPERTSQFSFLKSWKLSSIEGARKIVAWLIKVCDLVVVDFLTIFDVFDGMF